MKKLTLAMIGFLTFNLSFGQDPIFRAPIETLPKIARDLRKEGHALYKAKEYRNSAEKYSELFVALGNKGTKYDRYNAACSWALANEIDSSFVQLFILAEKGNYTNYSHITTDKDLSNLISDPRWEELIKKIKKNKENRENEPLDYGYGPTDAATITLGSQEWISKNLNVSTFANGDSILQVKSREEWAQVFAAKQSAWAYYNFDPANGDLYGKLYNWYAVYDWRGLAPDGWHIPSNDEWMGLINNLGGYRIAGKQLKSDSGWANNGNGLNSNGFDALPGGWMIKGNGYQNVEAITQVGYWWTTKKEWNKAFVYLMHFQHSQVKKWSVEWGSFLSVRCLRPSNLAIDYGYGLSDAYTVDIGTQRWISKNLNVSTFSNGDSILEAKTSEEWEKALELKQPAWCYYGNDPKNGPKYGKLYNRFAVTDPRGLAPKGSRIPNEADWEILIEHLGGEEKAGSSLKSNYWWHKDKNGTLEIGFIGRPGGFRGSNIISGGENENLTFNNVRTRGYWYSSAREGSTEMRMVSLRWFDSNSPIETAPDNVGLYVRCILE